MFARAVVFDLVAADELFTDGDLRALADDSDVDLATPVGVPGSTARQRR